jgi:putative ATPase
LELFDTEHRETKQRPGKNPEFVPLAERMRPKTLDDFVGQKHLIGEGKAIRLMIENNDIF